MSTQTFDFFETSRKAFGPVTEISEIAMDAFQKTVELQLEIAGDAMELITDELAVFGEAEGPTDYFKAQGKLATTYAARAQQRMQALVGTCSEVQQTMLDVARKGFSEAVATATPAAKPTVRRKKAA